MITTRCPTCGNEMRVPDSIAGKKVRCKEPACGATFSAVQYVAAAAVAPSGASVNEMFQPTFPEPEWSSSESIDPPIDERRERKMPKGPAKAPEFSRYLEWFRGVARIQLGVMLVIAAFSLWVAIDAFVQTNLAFKVVIRPLIISVLGFVLMVVMAFFVFTASMLGAAFVEWYYTNKVNTKS